jgi:hypothetical protein
MSAQFVCPKGKGGVVAGRDQQKNLTVAEMLLLKGWLRKKSPREAGCSSQKRQR